MWLGMSIMRINRSNHHHRNRGISYNGSLDKDAVMSREILEGNKLFMKLIRDPAATRTGSRMEKEVGGGGIGGVHFFIIWCL